MLRNSGAADGKAAGELADGGWAAAQQIEDGLARGIGERAQQLPLVGHTLR